MYSYEAWIGDFAAQVLLAITVVTTLGVAILVFLFWPRKKTANDLHLQAQLDEINGDFEAGRISYEELQRRITEAKSSLTQ